ncbi:MAG: hypothetical protein CM1200mP39_18610 [Dehalococcoidia bacterium]|nr:MAG: hypothetical protein CM1200mP39_18610 [Dehalococcoidia bacterium]
MNYLVQVALLPCEKRWVEILEVASVTGEPEILDGRVKTLHPKIQGGLFGKRNNPEHISEMQEHGIEGIDVVVNNLYPFHRLLPIQMRLLMMLWKTLISVVRL